MNLQKRRSFPISTDMKQFLKKFIKTRKFAFLASLALGLLCVAIVAVSAGTVAIFDGENEITMRTWRDNPESILNAANVEFSPYDEIETERISRGRREIHLHRAFDVDIINGDDTITVQFTRGTVRDALVRAGFNFGEHCELNYDIDLYLAPNMQIRYDEVRLETVTHEEEIAFNRTTRQSNQINQGERQVERQGRTGIQLSTIMHRLVNGTLAEVTVVETSVVRNPIDEITLIGTRQNPPQQVNATVNNPTTPAGRQAVKTSADVRAISGLMPSNPIPLDANGRPIQYIERLSVPATAYTSQDPGVGTRTATGRQVRTGYVAVNTNIIPMGSQMFIRTADGSWIYGFAQAEDTGGFATNGSGVVVDLFFESRAEALRFGRRDVEIFVLRRGR